MFPSRLQIASSFPGTLRRPAVAQSDKARVRQECGSEPINLSLGVRYLFESAILPNKGGHMNYRCSLSMLWTVLLAGLLASAGFVHAQASGPAGGIQSGMSGAQSAQGPALAGQGSSAGGARATTGGMPEGSGAEKGMLRDKGLSGNQPRPNAGSTGAGPSSSREGASTPGTGAGSAGF
jgi:hypothetical protein